ncbi:MAG: tetratricopeptide repeat protein [Tissierellia bacterium]|nr:tetratricopeptide repeat protein [Tissierellia bacterium]
MKEDIIYFKEKSEELGQEVSFPIFASYCGAALKKNKNIEVKHILATMMYLIGQGEEVEYYKTLLNKDLEFSVRSAISVADEFSEEGDYDTALSIYHGALIISDNDYRILFNIALTFEKKYLSTDGKEENLMKESERILHLVLDKKENFPPAIYKLGYIAKNKGNFLEAKLYFEKFIKYSEDELLKSEIREEIDILSNDSLLEEGLIYFENRKYPEAIESFKKIKTPSSNVEYYLAMSYLQVGEIESAIKSLENAIELEPNNWAFYNDLGYVYFDNNLYLEAIKIYSLGIENAETNYIIYANRSLGYTMIGEYKKALEDIKIAYELNEDEALLARYEELKGIVGE